MKKVNVQKTKTVSDLLVALFILSKKKLNKKIRGS
jgi:hypothetical protein